jgi:ferredoxin, 2Fe-2S
MARITYVTPAGPTVVDADAGISLMQLALRNGIPGIIGECGGVMSCATCHVYVDAAWYDLLPPAKDGELAMLEFADERAATSRLCCQIKVRDELDGLIVYVPQAQ